eukprot:XP_001704550.1 Hypothetical protein GL50803_36991 [Giardia lamblia ATCC 50803]
MSRSECKDAARRIPGHKFGLRNPVTRFLAAGQGIHLRIPHRSWGRGTINGVEDSRQDAERNARTIVERMANMWRQLQNTSDEIRTHQGEAFDQRILRTIEQIGRQKQGLVILLDWIVETSDGVKVTAKNPLHDICGHLADFAGLSALM